MQLAVLNSCILAYGSFGCFFQFHAISVKLCLDSVLRVPVLHCEASKALGRFATSLIWGTSRIEAKNHRKLRETPLPAAVLCQLRPQYKEDVETVCMCLESVAQSTYAKSSIGIVLAMEEREPNARGLGSLACLPLIADSVRSVIPFGNMLLLIYGECAFQIQILPFGLWRRANE